MAPYPYSPRYEGPAAKSYRANSPIVLYGRRSGTTMRYMVNPHDRLSSSRLLILNMRMLLTQPEYLLGRTLLMDWANWGTKAGRSSHFMAPAIRYVALPRS